VNTGAGNNHGIKQPCTVRLQADPVERRTAIMVNVSREGQVFRCEICGNIVVVKEAGGGELICCGEPMQLEE
jgi:desulfoferrodoxin-like iron-binding protein